jgi:hypothetical protein
MAAAQTPDPPRPTVVPDTVKRVLANVGCHRPQGSKAQTITRGHFVRPNQEDWAALCESGPSSFIYIVWGGTAQCPSTLATRRNADRMLRTHGPDSARHIDHDGIEDTSAKSAATIHYCVNRSWVSSPN